MTKQEYLILRNNNQLSIPLAFDYYKQITEDQTLDIHTFTNWFTTFVAIYKPNFSDLYNYYDQKFEVTRIINVSKSIIIKYI